MIKLKKFYLISSKKMKPWLQFILKWVMFMQQKEMIKGLWALIIVQLQLKSLINGTISKKLNYLTKLVHMQKLLWFASN